MLNSCVCESTPYRLRMLPSVFDLGSQCYAVCLFCHFLVIVDAQFVCSCVCRACRGARTAKTATSQWRRSRRRCARSLSLWFELSARARVLCSFDALIANPCRSSLSWFSRLLRAAAIAHVCRVLPMPRSDADCVLAREYLFAELTPFLCVCPPCELCWFFPTLQEEDDLGGGDYTALYEVPAELLSCGLCLYLHACLFRLVRHRMYPDSFLAVSDAVNHLPRGLRCGSATDSPLCCPSPACRMTTKTTMRRSARTVITACSACIGPSG
jgi:hypothetical protein